MSTLVISKCNHAACDVTLRIDLILVRNPAQGTYQFPSVHCHIARVIKCLCIPPMRGNRMVKWKQIWKWVAYLISRHTSSFLQSCCVQEGFPLSRNFPFLGGNVRNFGSFKELLKEFKNIQNEEGNLVKVKENLGKFKKTKEIEEKKSRKGKKKKTC